MEQANASHTALLCEERKSSAALREEKDLVRLRHDQLSVALAEKSSAAKESIVSHRWLLVSGELLCREDLATCAAQCRKKRRKLCEQTCVVSTLSEELQCKHSELELVRETLAVTQQEKVQTETHLQEEKQVFNNRIGALENEMQIRVKTEATAKSMMVAHRWLLLSDATRSRDTFCAAASSAELRKRQLLTSKFGKLADCLVKRSRRRSLSEELGSTVRLLKQSAQETLEAKQETHAMKDRVHSSVLVRQVLIRCVMSDAQRKRQELRAAQVALEEKLTCTIKENEVLRAARDKDTTNCAALEEELVVTRRLFEQKASDLVLIGNQVEQEAFKRADVEVLLATANETLEHIESAHADEMQMERETCAATVAGLEGLLAAAQKVTEQQRAEIAKVNSTNRQAMALKDAEILSLSRSNERAKAELEKMSFAKKEASMFKAAKIRAEEVMKELKLDLDHWRAKAESLDAVEDRTRRLCEDIACFEQECADLRQQNHDLSLTMHQFKDENEMLVGENSCLKQSAAMFEGDLERVTGENAKLIGHVNHKQKIHYTMRMKEEINQVRTELKRARQRIVQLELSKKDGTFLDALSSASHACGIAETPGPARGRPTPATTPARALRSRSGGKNGIPEEQSALVDLRRRCHLQECSMERMSSNFQHLVSLVDSVVVGDGVCDGTCTAVNFAALLQRLRGMAATQHQKTSTQTRPEDRPCVTPRCSSPVEEHALFTPPRRCHGDDQQTSPVADGHMALLIDRRI
uniref:Hyaluronan-mediated motility receptor C-terminal domain-containing protein n=1 Tax=Noctiluca scintillans TaxID=2966 RepID=A0A7S1FH99_NOCSC